MGRPQSCLRTTGRDESLIGSGGEGWGACIKLASTADLGSSPTSCPNPQESSVNLPPQCICAAERNFHFPRRSNSHGWVLSKATRHPRLERQ